MYSVRSSEALGALRLARRPVLIIGAGARLHEARELSRALGVPVAPTWGALDLFPSDDPLTIGPFGTHGTKHGNLAVQNADWILAIGSRLDTKATSTPACTFAPGARKFVVDVDEAELRKFDKLGVAVTAIHSDAGMFLRAALGTELDPHDFSEWRGMINSWRSDPDVPEVIRALSDEAREGDIICCDTGCTVAWVTQAWRFKEGQRLVHAWNQTPMGYGLPAAIGAHYATGKRVLLIAGDGGFMMSLAELATAKGLPIKIALLDNKGHAMCRQTQREWIGGTYPATSIAGGLKFPNLAEVARAFGADLQVYEIDPDRDVVPKLKYGEPLAELLA